MSCYIDIGDGGIELGPGPEPDDGQPGMREDAFDAFLTATTSCSRTVTAGGFFSIGGMTAVDVHGGTSMRRSLPRPLAFTILGADGTRRRSTPYGAPVRRLDAASVCPGFALARSASSRGSPSTSCRGPTRRRSGRHGTLSVQRQAGVHRQACKTADRASKYDRHGGVLFTLCRGAESCPSVRFRTSSSSVGLSPIPIRKRRTVLLISQPPVPSRGKASWGRRSLAGWRVRGEICARVAILFQPLRPVSLSARADRPASRPSR